MLDMCTKCRETNKHFIGRLVYVPKGRKSITRPTVIAMKRQGLRVWEIARKLGVTERRIFQVLQLKPKT